MIELGQLPQPHLDARRLGARRIPALIDEELALVTGVHIAFTGRAGGVSKPPYDELDLATHVGDDPVDVERNRVLLLDALGASGASLVALNQVHGTDGVEIVSREEGALAVVRENARAGADYALVAVPNTAALLCFADCAPLIVVSPTGRFAVVHAGWRGTVAHIASKAVRALAHCDGDDAGPSAAHGYNAYIGPHIRSECFECGDEVVRAFVDGFGSDVAPDPHHVDLSAALREDLASAGVDPARIVDAGICTKCHFDQYYSYRASGGVCGRHGAIAVRLPR